MKKINYSIRNSPAIHVSSGTTIRIKPGSHQKIRDLENPSTLDFLNGSMNENTENIDDKSFESQKINFIKDESTPPRKVKPKVAKSYTRLSTNKRFNCYKPSDPSDLLRKSDLKRHNFPSPLMTEIKQQAARRGGFNSQLRNNGIESVKIYRAYQSPGHVKTKSEENYVPTKVGSMQPRARPYHYIGSSKPKIDPLKHNAASNFNISTTRG